MFRSEFCFSLMFHSTFLLPPDQDRHFHIRQKTFLLVSDMSDSGSQKRKVHEMDNKSEDNSDFKVVAASLIQKRKTWPFLLLGSHLQMSRKLLRDYVALLVGLQSPVKWDKKNYVPFLGPPWKGERVFCKLCRKDFLCAHHGQYDCRKHTKSRFHKNNAEQASTSGNVRAFFAYKEKPAKDKCKMASHGDRCQNVWNNSWTEPAPCNSRFSHEYFDR